jgi:hypothetical protein
MDVLTIENIFSFMDWIMASDPQDVTKYVDKIRSDHPSLNRREVAQKIIDEQALVSGFLGTVTGFGTLITLPITISLDILKAWKIQDFTIRCIAYVYGYKPHHIDLKTAILLLMSNGSIEELKQFVIVEATNVANQYTLSTFDTWKHSAIQMTAKEGSKYAVQALTKCSEKVIANLGMKEISKYFMEGLCKIAGKKVAEKILEKSLGATVPVIGAAIGGGVDWVTTQTVGKLAIEYFENGGPEFVNNVFNLRLQ